jgi:hypothetical protein
MPTTHSWARWPSGVRGAPCSRSRSWKGLAAGDVQRELGQLGDGAGDRGQRCLLVAIEHHQAFQHQLAQHPQRGGDVKSA